VRFFATCLAAALGAALLALSFARPATAGEPGAGAGAPAPVAASVDVQPPTQPATDAEEAAYAEREAASPEVGEFSGGVVVVYVSLFGVLVIVLLLILISGAVDHHHA
jgi:hypothetical protein